MCKFKGEGHSYIKPLQRDAAQLSQGCTSLKKATNAVLEACLV
jgi:hypothetical protein